MASPSQRGFECEVASLALEEAQALQHHSASGYGGAFWPIVGKALRDRVGVDEILDDQYAPQQVGGTLPAPFGPASTTMSGVRIDTGY